MCQLPIDAINEGTTFHPYPTEFMLSEDYMRILDQEIRKQYSFSQLETDFGTIKFASFPSMKTKNKKKVKVPSVRALLLQRKELFATIDRLRKDLYEKNEHVSHITQRGNRSEVRIQELQERDQQRLKAIGLYFATIDSESIVQADSLEHLRKLRAEIFA